MLLLGATGTIGRATARALLVRGHEVLCVVRPGADLSGLPEVETAEAELTRPGALASALSGRKVDVVMSCLASRTGVAADAWAVEYEAHVEALAVARDAGAGHMVLLSAICVQKPRLAFQHAKLAFEAVLRASGLRYSIVRPTAYFKSLSGQLARVRAGKPYLLFSDGRLTACKPISDRDLAAYLVDCLDDPARWDRVLPIGGPGPALTPRDMGAEMFRLTGQTPRFRSVPPGLLRWIGAGLGVPGCFVKSLAAKAELARIGHYYATESMLVWDAETGRYLAEATPETGRDRLVDHYAALIRAEATDDRGAHAVF